MRIMKLIAPREGEPYFLNSSGRHVEVELDDVDDVLALTLGVVEGRNSIEKLTYDQCVELILANGDYQVREVLVNDDIDKLPKVIRYGNGLWKPEITLKFNNKRNPYSLDDKDCYYEELPGGVYLWEIKYKNDSKDMYIRTNDSPAFGGEHLVGAGLTLSDAVFEIEKGLRTKHYTDFSEPNEEMRQYFDKSGE